MPLVSRTRAILRRAEFGFLGVTVATRVQTPRRCGAATRRLRPWPDLSPGVVTFFFWGVRPLRTSWLLLGMRARIVAMPPRNLKVMAADRPILALDVDGTISLFGFDGGLDEAPGRFHLIDGVAHVIPDEAGGRIRRLAERFELIWATGWEERANDRLPEILGLPEELPAL